MSTRTGKIAGGTRDALSPAPFCISQHMRDVSETSHSAAPSAGFGLNGCLRSDVERARKTLLLNPYTFMEATS